MRASNTVSHFKHHDARKAAAKAHYEANKERVLEGQRWAHVKYTYGLTKDQFDALLESQDGVCAICKRVELTGKRTRLSVDHDHKCCDGPRSCGECVRGLLCQNCNSGISRLEDYMEAAKAYLER